METLLDTGVNILLPQFTSQILSVLEDIQSAQKPPFSDGVYWLEIRKEWRKRQNGILLTVVPVIFDPLFCKFFRSDGLFVNSDCTKYSLKKIKNVFYDKKGEQIVDEYFKYSEGIQNKFPGYELNEQNIVENVEDFTIDLEKHIQFLKSYSQKDLQNYNLIKNQIFGSQARFLSGKQNMAISYTSYPRSGNTFLRKYFENITGIATGSDQLMKFNLNVSLQYSGFKGEGIVNQGQCWINKTHFPFRTPMDKQYETNVVLLAVRNPLDVFVSFFNLIGTQTHSKSIREDLNSLEIQPFWDSFFESDLKVWVEWHDYWMEKVKEKSIPIFFFRFEDLIVNPEQVLRQMFKFILAQKNIDGTIIEQRIKEVISEGKNFLYKPRSAGGGLHKHADKLSQSQMKDLMDKLEYYIHFFGYAKSPKSYQKKQENSEFEPLILDFYDYGDKAQKQNEEAYLDFIKINEEMLQLRLAQNENDLNNHKIKNLKPISINQYGSGFSMLNKKEIIKYVELIEHTTLRDRPILS